MKVTERFTRTADDTVSYKFTVEDPTTWDRSWTADAPLVKTEGPIFEFASETRDELDFDKERLLANGDRWEREFAKNIALDAPFR